MSISLHTHLYNLLHTGNQGDIDYYIRSCHQGQKILELGCGNGRVCAALIAHGCEVTCIDNDADMLKAFHAKTKKQKSSAKVHLADMRDFQLNTTFDTVIIPFNGLLCMLSMADVDRTLRCVRNHLSPGGQLIFDIYYVPSDFKNEGFEEDSYIDTTTLTDDGTKIEVYEKTLVGDDAQRFDTSYMFVTNQHTPLEKQVEMTVKQRCIYPNQIEAMLQRNGFNLASLTADFTSSPICDDTQQVVVVATPLQHK